MSISNRVFGEDIPVIIKKKLEARQRIALKTQTPNTEIKPSSYPDDKSTYYTFGAKQGLLNLNFEGEADISSRTPFARMWTAVEIKRYERLSSYKFNKDEGAKAKKMVEESTEDLRYEYIKDEASFRIFKAVAERAQKVYTLGSHLLNSATDPHKPMDELRYLFFLECHL